MNLTIWQTIFLALLQGVTELFPISSLGHTVILPGLLGWGDLVRDERESPLERRRGIERRRNAGGPDAHLAPGAGRDRRARSLGQRGPRPREDEGQENDGQTHHRDAHQSSYTWNLGHLPPVAKGEGRRPSGTKLAPKTCQRRRERSEWARSGQRGGKMQRIQGFNGR